MCWEKAKTNLWPEVRQETGVRLITKSMLFMTAMTFTFLAVHTINFGPFGPVGRSAEIFGLVVNDYQFNEFNRYLSYIVMGTVSLWVFQVYAVSRRLQTTAYKKVRSLALAKKVFRKKRLRKFFKFK